MDTAKVIAENLQAAMNDKGINAQELSFDSRVAPSRISDLLRERNQNPTIGTLRKLADALGVTVPYLITEKQQSA